MKSLVKALIHTNCKKLIIIAKCYVCQFNANVSSIGSLAWLKLKRAHFYGHKIS